MVWQGATVLEQAIRADALVEEIDEVGNGDENGEDIAPPTLGGGRF